jgi:SAM-dependent methyltransferase
VQQHAYAFGDTPTASARLDVLASVFAPASRSLLAEVLGEVLADCADRLGPGRAQRLDPGRAAPAVLVLDLGCGPGHTTAMLAGVFTSARVVGMDTSVVFVSEGSTRAGDRCRFVVADATRVPFPCAPADVVYARFLVVHLPDPRRVVVSWAGQVRPGGVVVVEEPERIDTDDEDFRRYLELASVVVADRGGDLYAGRQLVDLVVPPEVVRVVDRRAPLDVAAGSAASIFALNLSTWGGDPALSQVTAPGEAASLLARLEERRADPSMGVIRWYMRQLVLRRDRSV